MRIVIADCSVVYSGRGDTKLNQGVRAIFLKEDGAISIHNDKGNKPINYMGKDSVFSDITINGERQWLFDTHKENLAITLHSILSDQEYALDLKNDELIKDGTEEQLQQWLVENPTALGDNYTIVEREFETGDGRVDILAKDPHGIYVAVEVKRVATAPAVTQINRYVKAMHEQPEFKDARGLIVALDIRPKTLALAEKRGYGTHVIDNELWKKRKDTLSVTQ